ncbi:MAG: ribonuclease Z [Actinobacteria bacterium]|nr:ribonuclease Z [Actinomycetota bacterium]
MEITLLGTGSPIPDPNRAGPSTLVRAGESLILADCGRGVVLRLAAAGVMPPMLSAVLITHLHSDHLTDLNDVVTTRWVMSPMPNPITIYGPPRTAEVVEGMMAMLAPDISYRLAHHEDLNDPPAITVVEVQQGDAFTIGDVSVTVAATDHRPVEPTVAFRLEQGGVSTVLGGDGVPCDTLEALCAGADAYVQTVLREDIVRMVPMQRFNDILDYHSTVEQAAQVATRAGVKTLVLTHYVPGIQPGQEDEWRSLAAAHFDGEIVLGPDLTSVTIG